MTLRPKSKHDLARKRMTVAQSLAVAAVAIAGLLIAHWFEGGAGPVEGAGKATQTDFDFYVLALSWSPTWCEERGNESDADMQCAAGRPFAFVVHGLWPQNERGWPEFCDGDQPERIDRGIADDMLDIMPSRDLVFHQWRKHGRCSGLSPQDYFALVRKAHAAISIPETYGRAAEWRNVRPGEIEAAFIANNPGLQSNAIAVTCSNRYLREVRICLDRDLGWRGCPEVDAKSCQTARTTMPPARKG
jgi:ribonuclease T2